MKKKHGWSWYSFIILIGSFLAFIITIDRENRDVSSLCLIALETLAIPYLFFILGHFHSIGRGYRKIIAGLLTLLILLNCTPLTLMVCFIYLSMFIIGSGLSYLTINNLF